ncbi:MAG: hypothetical protein H0T80_09075 [Betaproteobacteria bacterium]|nr:hypothetical protein [Betaproteobacteria bacterium]
MSDQLAVALLTQIRDELRAIHTTLAARRPAASVNDDSAADLLRAIAATTRGLTFTVSELLEHAEIVADRAADQRLHDAIVAACGAVNGRRLGKLLGRLEGRELDGLRVVRVGVGRDGIAWRVVAGLRV